MTPQLPCILKGEICGCGPEEGKEPAEESPVDEVAKAKADLYMGKQCLENILQTLNAQLQNSRDQDEQSQQSFY